MLTRVESVNPRDPPGLNFLRCASGIVDSLVRRVAARYVRIPETDYKILGHRRGLTCPHCALPAFCDDCNLCESCKFAPPAVIEPPYPPWPEPMPKCPECGGTPGHRRSCSATREAAR